MFGFSAKLPITDEERLWVDQGFYRLEKLLGRKRMLESRAVLPTPDGFPDHYDKSPAAAERLCVRACNYMQVDRDQLTLEIFSDETEELQEIVPHWHGGSSGCAGFYAHDNDCEEERGRKQKLVAIRGTHLKDPLCLVAVMAHELGHVILLGGGLISSKTADHEPLTDLLTVFLGFGVFNANAAGRFKQFQDERHQGWSMQRVGYLSEEIYGYALARFARERGEQKPEWDRYFQQTCAHTTKEHVPGLRKLSGDNGPTDRVTTLLQIESFLDQPLQARLVQDVVGKFLVREHGQRCALRSCRQFGSFFDRQVRVLADHRHHHADHDLQAPDLLPFG